jgi:hypothetical protein
MAEQGGSACVLICLLAGRTLRVWRGASLELLRTLGGVPGLIVSGVGSVAASGTREARDALDRP